MSLRFSPLISGASGSDAVHDSGMCEPSLNLLAHAQAIELEIGSRCGGHGVCGGDKVQLPAELRDGFSPITEQEREHLTEGELESGWRLACQCFPDRDDLSGSISFCA